MKLSLSTHLLVYGELDSAGMQAIADAGCQESEVWLAEPHVRWRSASAMTELRKKLEDSGSKPGTVHLPFYPSVGGLLDHGEKWSVIDPDSKRRQIALDGMAEGFQAAATLGARAGVLHLGWPGDLWTTEHLHWAEAAVYQLLPVAKECGVQLLLENIISTGTRAKKLVRLLDKVDPDGQAGVCLDLGHAHVEGNILEELADALPRLSHLHVHDNDGCKDQHSAPGQGTIPWRSLLQKLQDISYQGSGALELRDFSKGAISPAEVIQKEMGHVRKFHQHWASRDLLTPSIKI